MRRVLQMACICASIVCPFVSSSAPLNISGILVDSEQNSLPFATISLHHKQDSTLVKVTLSNEDGTFAIEFEPKSYSAYFLKVSMPFYESFSKEIQFDNNSSSIDVGKLQLVYAAKGLGEIQVSGKKPFLERKADRLIINVENGIMSAGSSAFEILEKTPGVTVNLQDAISLNGKSGVQIYVDGKVFPLSGADLSNYLKSLPSNSVDRIELITNPSSKYDAAGNAGIIDIRMKKDNRFGTNGSANANYGQGVYPKAGIGLNLNHRTSQMNWFGSTNYSFRKGMNKLNLYREFFENDIKTGAYDQKNFLLFPYHNNGLRLGADYYLPNDKTIIGFVFSGSLNQFKPNGQNNSIVENGNQEHISSFSTRNNSQDVWPSYSINLNFKHSFDSLGTDLNLDIDQARYWNMTEQNFLTRYYDVQLNPLLPDYYLFGDLRGHLDLLSIKADFSKPLWGGKLGTGIKSSKVKADNDLKFYDRSKPIEVFDSTKSNHFVYQENINAAYLNFARDFDKFNIQAGLRAEQTIADGIQLINQTSFKKDYFDLFPSIFVNYNISPEYIMGFNVSRRLDRPNYQQLNPFKFFLDPSTYKEGNPGLDPQYSWVYEWNHNIRRNYSIAFSYTKTYDNITEVIGPVAGQERITVQTHENLREFDYYSVSASGQFDLFKFWSCMLSTNAWIGTYKGNYAETELNSTTRAFSIGNNHSLNLGKSWNAEINFNYQSAQVYGFMDLEPIWGLGVGIQKQFLNKKASVKLSASDLFWTNLPKAVISYRDYIERFDVKRETRVLSLSFNYRFGNNKIAGNRKRTGGAEDEKRRASGSF